VSSPHYQHCVVTMSETGCQSALGATKTLHGLHSPNLQQQDDTDPLPDKHNTTHSVTKATQRPSSASTQRPPSASGRSRRAVRHNVGDSYVDESLFGHATDSTLTTSWQTKQRPVKPFIFDCTDYKAKASNSNRSSDVPHSRPANQMLIRRSRPRSARLCSEPSFVDESLFGDQLEASTWRAPWDKKDSRPKPLIFDATNYREKQKQMNNADNRSSAKTGSTRLLPPWR